MQVLALTALALGVARLARAPKGTWRYILGVAAAILLASQFLPAGHPFREDVAESSYNLAWLGIALIPVGIYGLWIRRLRVRSGADAPEPATPENDQPRSGDTHD